VAADRAFEQQPSRLLEHDAVTATDPHQAGIVELGRRHSGLVRVHPKPIGHAVDRGVPVLSMSGLVGEGLAEGTGTAGGHNGLIVNPVGR
jgi:hypothetical protein